MQDTSERKSAICIVGVGAITAVGLTAPSTAAAVRAGISGFSEHPFMVDHEEEPMIVARVPKFVGARSDLDRCCRLVVRPACEALLPIKAQRPEIGSIPVFLGLPPQRPGRPVGLEQQLVDMLQQVGPVGPVECIPAGHSAGLMALEAASRRVVANPSSFCLVGGLDSYLEPDTLDWLEQSDQLHGGDNAYGFIPGEAAGFCLLCSQQAAENLNLRVLARVWAAGTAHEKSLIKTDSVCLGKGLTDVFRKVFAQLPSSSDRIDGIVCDMNGEPYRADEYGFAVSRLSNRFANASDFTAPADCWGDVGAASGPLFAILIAAAGQRGYAKGRHLLVWTSSESGERSAAVLHHELPVKR